MFIHNFKLLCGDTSDTTFDLRKKNEKTALQQKWAYQESFPGWLAFLPSPAPVQAGTALVGISAEVFAHLTMVGTVSVSSNPRFCYKELAPISLLFYRKWLLSRAEGCCVVKNCPGTLWNEIVLECMSWNRAVTESTAVRRSSYLKLTFQIILHEQCLGLSKWLKMWIIGRKQDLMA